MIVFMSCSNRDDRPTSHKGSYCTVVVAGFPSYDGGLGKSAFFFFFNKRLKKKEKEVVN